MSITFWSLEGHVFTARGKARNEYTIIKRGSLNCTLKRTRDGVLRIIGTQKLLNMLNEG